MSAQFQTQTVDYPTSFAAPRFAFLSQPPPQKKRARPPPTAPLPAPPGTPPPVPRVPAYAQQRMRSNANPHILAWSLRVQPGSPAPRSPHRRLSITSTTSSRRSSISRLHRRPSITHARAPSGSSFIIIDSPTMPPAPAQHTPSTSAGKFDLTTLGYASVFVQFPKTPTTPSAYLRQHEQKRQHAAAAAVPASPKPQTPGPKSAFAFSSSSIPIPIPPIPQHEPAPAKHKVMKRIRSLSILRPRSSKPKSHAAAPSSPRMPASPRTPISPTKSTISTRSAKRHQLATSAAAITRRKQATYASKSKSKGKSVVRPPPSLANELALMQFADGGSLESCAKHLMHAQAKAAAGAGGVGGSVGVGVGDVHRDGKGGMWWDAEEEMEYAPLLRGEAEMEVDWEEFGDGVSPLTPFWNTGARLHHLSTSGAACGPLLIPIDSPRRSRASISTQDSDLDPARALPLPELEDRNIGGVGMSVLSLPSRPRRALAHLRQPAAFLVDAAAFAPRNPISNNAHIHHAVPLKTPLTPTTFIASTSAHAQAKTKVRRRPAPLKLTSSAYASGKNRRSPMGGRRAVALASPHPATRAVAIPSPRGVERTRREFIEDSFVPSPLPAPVGRVPTAVPEMTGLRTDAPTERAVKRRGVLGLFALTRKAD